MWGLFRRDKSRAKKYRPERQSWTSGWTGPAAGKVVWVLVLLVVFGTLAFLVIYFVVRLFSGFFRHYDEVGLI